MTPRTLGDLQFVLLWSDEHRAWWRPDGMGYTQQHGSERQMTLPLPARPPSLDSPSWRAEVQALVDLAREGAITVEQLRAWVTLGSLAAKEALAQLGGIYAGRVR